MTIALIILLMLCPWGLRAAFRPRPQADPLDRTIMTWPSGDHYTLRHLLEGGLSIMGRSGSGKSSGSLYQIARRFIALGNNGGCIHASSPSDREFWKRIFAEANRADDLLVFSPTEPLRFNFLDAEMANGGDTRNITKLLLVVGESLSNDDTQGGGGRDDFWAQQNESWLFDAVEIVKMAKGRVTVGDLIDFFNTAAISPAQLSDESWKARTHNKMIEVAFFKEKDPIQRHDFERSKDAWLIQWPAMNDRTRTSISAGIMGILHVLATGYCRELLSTDTNVSPAVFEESKWILIDWPVSKGGAPAAFVNSVWKLATQNHVLARDPKPGAPIIASIVDEYQRLCNSRDSTYLNESRKFLGTTIAATQSLHSYLSAMKGKSGSHLVEALLSAFGTKIFHALGDAKSAEFASGLLGQRREVFVSVSEGEPVSAFDEIMGRSSYRASYQEQVRPVIEPRLLLSGLRTGGPSNKYCVDSYVVRTGEPFRGGANHQFVTFSQRP